MTNELKQIEKADMLSRQVLNYSRNTLFLNLRFLENALSRLVLMPYEGTVATDSRYLYYDSRHILSEFRIDEKHITRSYLHMVLHCIFQHSFVNPSIRIPLWNLACDIAVEIMIRELNLKCIDNSCESAQNRVLQELKSNLKYMTAEKIYYYYTEKNISDSYIEQLQELFCEDDHSVWYKPPENIGSNSGENQSDSDGNGDNQSDSDGNDENQSDNTSSVAMSREEAQAVWKKLSQQIQTDLETFSKQQGTQAGSMMQNLLAVNREKYDYSEFLRKFSVYGEVMKIDEDSFDYNFYMYGLSLYKNVALVEPLEYKDVKRIKEFVIAIDTSGSVSGEIVQKFVEKTYNILKSQESFFTKVNIHIIQCDTKIQEDAKITTQEEFDEYIKTMTLKGFGGTDFRPVFGYVNELVEKKEFTNLKGLLYFTDGFGTFPEQQPDYQTAFVFLDDDYNNYEVPVWAMRVNLETNQIMEEKYEH
jgi:predicted metal-dependent peptidase